MDTITASKLASLDRDKTMVMVAISPLEVHGPHLPIGQDWYEAQVIAEKTIEKLAAERRDWSFIIMPPVPVSIDCIPHLGSVNFPVKVVEDVAYYTMRPFAKEGFARLVFSSFHGSPRHNCALEAAAERLTRGYGVPVMSVFSAIINRITDGDIFYDAVKDSPSCSITFNQTTKDTHAGFVETSLALNQWPDLVEGGWEELPPRIKVPEEEEGQSYLYGDNEDSSFSKIKANIGRMSGILQALRHFKTNTYCGYPAKSSVESGELIMKHVTNVGKDVLADFMEKGSQMDVHSPLWKLRGIFLSKPINFVADNILKINY